MFVVTEVPNEVSQEGEISIDIDPSDEYCRDSSKLKEIENEISNDLITKIFDDACKEGSNCNIQAVADCNDVALETEEEITNEIKGGLKEKVINTEEIHSGETHIVDDKIKELHRKTREAPSVPLRKDKGKRKKLKVKFQIKAKLKNRDKFKLSGKVFEYKEKVKKFRLLGKNVTGVYLKQPKIVCPIGFATKRHKCGKINLNLYLF